jgi:transcriptional regulator with XRE-family HTH domain
MKSDPVIVNFARLRSARGGRSLREVAQLLGITYQQLWNIENGKRLPSLGVLVKLCALYDLPMDKIIVRKRQAA